MPDLAAEMRGIAIRFDANTVFEHVSFTAHRGEVFVILRGFAMMFQQGRCSDE